MGFWFLEQTENVGYHIHIGCRFSEGVYSMGQKLFELAVKFRKTIEAAQEAGEPNEYIRGFPRGQCGHISDIFSQYLIDSEIGPVFYVNGTYYGDDWDDRWSHTWLEVDGNIIDMTADQFKFNEVPLHNETPVYVGLMNDWYRLFDIEHGSHNVHKGLERQWFNYRELKECYETVKDYLGVE